MPIAGGSQEPIDDGTAGSGGAASKGGTASRGGSTATPNGGAGASHSGSGPTAGSVQGGSAQSEGGDPAIEGGSAGTGNGATAGSSAGSGGATSTHFLAWTFDGGASDWMIRDQSPELSAKLTTAAGAIELVDVPFSAVKQFVDVAYSFSPPADLRGRTLRVSIERTAGAFVGVQVYAYGSAWGSPSFDSLGSGGPVVLSVVLDDLVAKGVTPAQVARIGLKIGTGSNANGSFGTSSIRVSEVTID